MAVIALFFLKCIHVGQASESRQKPFNQTRRFRCLIFLAHPQLPITAPYFNAPYFSNLPRVACCRDVTFQRFETWKDRGRCVLCQCVVYGHHSGACIRDVRSSSHEENVAPPSAQVKLAVELVEGPAQTEAPVPGVVPPLGGENRSVVSHHRDVPRSRPAITRPAQGQACRCRFRMGGVGDTTSPPGSYFDLLFTLTVSNADHCRPAGGSCINDDRSIVMATWRFILFHWL